MKRMQPSPTSHVWLGMDKKTVFIHSKIWEHGDPLHKICLFFAHNDEPFWAPPSTRGSRVSHWGLSVGSIPGKTHQRHVVSMLFPQKSPMCQHVGSVTRPQSAFGDDQNNCFFPDGDFSMVQDQWVLWFCTSGNHDVRFKFFSLKSLARGSMCGHGAAGREGERLRGNILRAFT